MGEGERRSVTDAGSAEDVVQGQVRVFLDQGVGQPYDAQTRTDQDALTSVIVRLPRIVYSAIDLYDERRTVTIEVDDETTDDLLSPKVKSVEAVSPEKRPQGSLCWRHAAT
ncbi:MAG TPA: hypothetical protein VGI83_02305 [Gemmatimonadales bacterium]|jgi:hypothetical protein